MTGVELVDSSVLCELLELPNWSSAENIKEVTDAFTKKQAAGIRFVLPLATIVETGNHVNQIKPRRGGSKARWVELFVNMVRQAQCGKEPFLPTPVWNRDDVNRWMTEFLKKKDWKKSPGIGDLSIQSDSANAKIRLTLPSDITVKVWSIDKDLSQERIRA